MVAITTSYSNGDDCDSAVGTCDDDNDVTQSMYACNFIIGFAPMNEACFPSHVDSGVSIITTVPTMIMKIIKCYDTVVNHLTGPEGLPFVVPV